MQSRDTNPRLPAVQAEARAGLGVHDAAAAGAAGVVDHISIYIRRRSIARDRRRRAAERARAAHAAAATT